MKVSSERQCHVKICMENEEEIKIRSKSEGREDFLITKEKNL